MKKVFEASEWEEHIYSFWEEHGYLSAEEKSRMDKDKETPPFTILMPPPNANASLHAGHGMYAVDDVMIRWKRLCGFASLWIPGMDHAGFETQYVYEKQLAKKGQSRLDFDRETLFNNILQFVKDNSGLVYKQFRRLGFLADWKRSVFTLDEKSVAYVYETFKKMIDDGYVYRDTYLVNYCVHCGTSLAELEIKHIERTDALYYIRYPLVDEEGFVTVATVRPEPIFADTHLAVHPKDSKKNHLIGKKVKNPLTEKEMEIIGDEYVDPKFGTGVVKLTPAHDPNDFEVARKHGLPIVQAIDWRGKIVENGGKYAGLSVKKAREAVISDLTEKGLVEKIDETYVHNVAVCYKCGRDLEPLTVPNWFIRVDELKERVKKAVEEDKIAFYPKKYKQHLLKWLDIMHDWPISRQIVWGIRIPVWYKVDREKDNIWVWWIDTEKKLHQGSLNSFLKEGRALDEISPGLQKAVVSTGDDSPSYIVTASPPAGDYIQETDTFDTWFSSGQWPLITLKDDEWDNRFPTDFMGTLSDILRFWISRMILFSLYRKNDIPFKTVYLWSMVADEKGVKMSKSKGNVVNPIDLVDKYGADAFRGTLFFNLSQGGTVNLAEDKVRAMRNFANKIWNIGRYLKLQKEAIQENSDSSTNGTTHKYADILKALQKELKSAEKQFIHDMNVYNFSKAFSDMYEFLWHRYADYYIEVLKEPIKSGNIGILSELESAYLETLKLLHPFIPFVTEAVWKEFNGEASSILDERIIN